MVISPKIQKKKVSAQGYKESISPTTLGFVSAAFVVMLTVLVMDEVELTLEGVSNIRILGNNGEQGGASELVGIRNIPLYGDKNLQSRLSSEINESIFVVEPEEKPKTEKNIEPEKPKIKEVDWTRPTLKTLTLNGVSLMRNSAYINGLRYKVGDTIKDFPIKGDLQSKYASLTSVKEDQAVVMVGSKYIRLSLKE